MDALAAGPCKLLIIGGIGAGKSAALADARKVLHNNGISAITDPSALGEPGSAFVVDDAHLSPTLRWPAHRTGGPA